MIRAMPNTPSPDINGLYDLLNEVRRQAHGEAPTPLPPVEQLTAFAAIRVLIELTEQVHHLTLATREQNTELERARWRAEAEQSL